MANPNIVGVSTIFGVTTPITLSTTAATSILSNPSNSGIVYKINTITAANTNGTAAADFSLYYYNAASLGGTQFKLAFTISVPADSALVVVDRASSFYLEENRSIGAQASIGNYIDVICSYEQIQ
jgi:hypothetical protein